jgi:hypothetical protein
METIVSRVHQTLTVDRVRRGGRMVTASADNKTRTASHVPVAPMGFYYAREGHTLVLRRHRPTYDSILCQHGIGRCWIERLRR